MGLTGIDLFSPSDVVEKKDIRRVCMCIRALSKKAITKDLDIPDFDVVTYTVPMPTHMVKGIRKSLEQSRNRFSEDSAGCRTYFVSRSKNGQARSAFIAGPLIKRNWDPAFAGQCDTYSEESDNIDGNYTVAGFSSPDSQASWGGTSWGDASLGNSDIENSPRGSSLDLENFHTTQCVLQADEQNKETHGRNNGSRNRSPEDEHSFDAYHLLNDIHRFTDTLPHRTPPSRFDYLMEVNGRTSCGNKETARSLNFHEDEKIGVWPVNFDPKSYASSVGNSVDNPISERNVISLSGTSNGCTTDGDESVFSTHENDAVSNLRWDTDLESDLVNKILVFHEKKPFDAIEDGGVSLKAFTGLGKTDTSGNEDKLQGNDAIVSPSVLYPQHWKRVRHPLLVDSSTPNIDKLNLEEVDSAKDSLAKGNQLTISREIKGLEASGFRTPHTMPASYLCESPIGVSRDYNDFSYAYPAIDDLGISGPDIKGPIVRMRENLIVLPVLEDGFSATIESRNEPLNGKGIALATKKEMCNDPVSYKLNMVNADNILSVALDCCLQASESHTCKESTHSENNDREAETDQHLLDENKLGSAHQISKYHETVVANYKENMVKEQITPEQKGRDVGTSDHKGHRKRLLKTFVGGMSVFGAVVLLFHIRRSNGREKIKAPRVPSTQVGKMNNAETSQKNIEQKGRPDGVYPSENLKF